MKPHESPTDPSSVLAQLPAGKSPFLLACGQYSPLPDQVERVGILQGSRCLADHWLRTEDISPLAHALRGSRKVRRGQWDVMYATRWKYAWTTDGRPVEVWDRKGRLLWQEGTRLQFGTAPGVDVETLVGVEADLSDDWVHRRVRLVTAGSKPITVAAQTDRISLIDPTYDGFNILCDAAWTVSLANAIAAALDLPLRKHPAL